MTTLKIIPEGQVTSSKEIPSAPYYVCCNDSFMSGWGPAEGKTNTLIFVCETWEDARNVEQNAHDRTDQRYVRVCTSKPRLKPRGYVYQVKTKAKCERWYAADRPFCRY